MLKLLLGLVLAVGLSPAQSFYGAGVSGLLQGSPKPTGWAASVTTISAPQRIYSISETDFTVVGGKIQTSARSGLATYLRSFGPVDLFALADAGVATTGSVTSGAYAGGTIAVGPVSSKQPNLHWAAGFRVLKSAVGGTQLVGEVGFVWGKSK